MLALLLPLLLTHAPCEAPPKGMVCIPGGPAVLGADDHGAEEKPKHTAQIPTFYLDRTEVTNRDYAACARAEACPPRAFPEGAEALPATASLWAQAEAYCVWAGKRLPSEGEWEKGARGPDGKLYPCGDEAPSCERGNFKDCGNKPAKVGSSPAGAFGLVDMAGNSLEWVHDFWSPTQAEGDDAWGACAGAPTCKSAGRDHTLKGGSFKLPGDEARGSARRAGMADAGTHQLGFRCASTAPNLATFPALQGTEKRPAPPELTAPTADELHKFRSALVEDTDILQIPLCTKRGRAKTDCRDPMSYVKSNEIGHVVWRPYIENLGGGYVGLGSDQAYTFISSAKSTWAWTFDYDPAVVRTHYILRAIILNSPTVKDFLAGFALKDVKQTEDWIRVSLADNTSEIEPTIATFHDVRTQLSNWYDYEARPSALNKDYGWLRVPANYAYIRTMYQQGRIAILKGNMLTDKALPSVAASAKALGVPVRIYYPSNAEEQWVLPPQYKQNLLGLPFDEQSVVIRTLFGKRMVTKEKSYWHYIVHNGLHNQMLLRHEGYNTTPSFMEYRLHTDHDNLSLVGMPAKTEHEAAPR